MANSFCLSIVNRYNSQKGVRYVNKRLLDLKNVLYLTNVERDCVMVRRPLSPDIVTFGRIASLLPSHHCNIKILQKLDCIFFLDFPSTKKAVCY